MYLKQRERHTRYMYLKQRERQTRYMYLKQRERHTCRDMCLYICTDICIYIQCLYTHTHVRIYTCAHIYMCIRERKRDAK